MSPTGIFPTCLFTGVALTSATKIEHTIPESLGGRITSTEVTSSDFNNRSGSYIDNTIKLVYEPLINHLAPLLPSAAQPGKMPIHVPGERDGLVVERARVGRQGSIIEKGDDGKIKSVLGATDRQLRRLAQQQGKDPSQVVISHEPATTAPYFLKRVPVICREVELAALKAVLTTFDVRLGQAGDKFTRRPETALARNLVLESVIKRTVEPEDLASVSMGLQYEKTALYRELRKQVPQAETPFEHVLFAVANGPSRCLDAVWCVFGFDPFGFRLSTDWQGDPFGICVVNPIMRGMSASGPHQISLPDSLLCMPTNRCTLPLTSSYEEMKDVLFVISRERGQAFGEAVRLVEMTADDHVTECLVEAAKFANPEDRTAERQIALRVTNMYGRLRSDAAFVEEVRSIVRNVLAGQPDLAAIDDVTATTTNDLEAVVRAYRRCLQSVIDRFGDPGDHFLHSCGIILDPGDERLIGDLPKPDEGSQV